LISHPYLLASLQGEEIALMFKYLPSKKAEEVKYMKKKNESMNPRETEKIRSEKI